MCECALKSPEKWGYNHTGYFCLGDEEDHLHVPIFTPVGLSVLFDQSPQAFLPYTSMVRGRVMRCHHPTVGSLVLHWIG